MEKWSKPGSKSISRRNRSGRRGDKFQEAAIMQQDSDEVARRTAVALAAIKWSMKSGEGRSNVALFVSHHLKEIKESYWRQHVDRECPSSEQILDLLELRSYWGKEDEDGMDTIDFTLPDDATNYVIAVAFDESGEVQDISMES